MYLSLRLKDILGPVTRVKKKKRQRRDLKVKAAFRVVHFLEGRKGAQVMSLAAPPGGEVLGG